MPGYSRLFYELVEYKPRRNLLTRNRDKAVEHFQAGGVVRRGICHQYKVGGKWYPEGINYWEEFKPELLSKPLLGSEDLTTPTN